MGTQSSRTPRCYKAVVLIALYKSGEFIESKIKSLKSQTIIDDCVIVFLNCMNFHNESELCMKYAHEYDNVIHIEFDNYISLYESWNVGISDTISDYIVNYNADDQWHPEYLERCVNHLDNESNCAIVSTNVLITDIPNQIWPNWEHVDKMPSHVYPTSSAGPCPMWRRNLHDKYGMFEKKFVIGDARWWEMLHSNNERFDLIQEDLVLYYRHPNSLERRRNNDGMLLREIDLT